MSERDFDAPGLTSAERARDIVRRFPVRDGLISGDVTELGWFVARAILAAEAPLEDRVQELETALQPFAARGREIAQNPHVVSLPDTEEVEVMFTVADGDLTLGDFRRAAAVLGD